jgi:putative oxidoreductase
MVSITSLIPAQLDIAATVARVVLGLLFIVHGWPKVKNLKGTMKMIGGTGFPGGSTFALLFTLLEFFGGIALVIGLLTQVVAALIVLEMIATTIFAKSTMKKKFVGGYELDIIYLVLALLVLMLGAGAWSVDRLIGLA